MTLATDLSESAGQWQVVETTFTLPATQAWVQILQANPLRWGFVIGYAGGAPVAAVLSTAPGLKAAAAAGIILQSGAQPFQLDYGKAGYMVNVAWFAMANTGSPSVLTVIETLAVQTGGP